MRTRSQHWDFPVICTDRGQHKQFTISWARHADARPEVGNSHSRTSIRLKCPRCGRDVLRNQEKFLAERDAARAAGLESFDISLIS